jgi:hypothetical protein
MLIIIFLLPLFTLAANNPHGRHDFDFGGLCCFSLVFATTSNPHGHDLDIHGLGCSY